MHACTYQNCSHKLLHFRIYTFFHISCIPTWLGSTRLVDSRDIVELEVKHKKYEILIRKKEAVKWDSPPQTQTQPGLHVMAHSAFPQYYSPPPSPPQPAFESAAAPPPPAAAAPAPAKAAPGSPPMLSPMAGTFYRSPAPGEPSFVKVGRVPGGSAARWHLFRVLTHGHVGLGVRRWAIR